MKIKIAATALVLSFFLISTPQTVSAFSFGYVDQANYAYDPAGFFSGVWDGLIAPYSLIVRWFSPLNPIFAIGMYAYNNTGWFYDAGFLLGILFSIPFGWITAIIAFLAMIL